jgi:hypothetical protein
VYEGGATRLAQGEAAELDRRRGWLGRQIFGEDRR